MNIIKGFRNIYVYSYRALPALSSLGSQNPLRNVHISASTYYKLFREVENEYAYSVMEKKGYIMEMNKTKDYYLDKSYSISDEEFNSLVKSDFTNMKPTELFKLLPKFGIYCSKKSLCISDKMFDDYIDNLTDNIKHATDEELEGIFYSLLKWPETPSAKTRNYIEIWAALDDVCMSRQRDWTRTKILKFMNLFSIINVIKFSDFYLKGLWKLSGKADRLTPQELVQTFYFIGLRRSVPGVEVINLEGQLKHLFDQLSIDELAIAGLGFFKTKTPLRNIEIIRGIICRIIEHHKDVSEISLAALLKVIRYSWKGTDDLIYGLLDTLQHEVPRLSIMCNIHIAILGTSTLTLHKECLTKIVEHLMKSMPQARLKDLERIVLTLGMFNFKPPTEDCIFEKVLEQLRKPERQKEIEEHSNIFACCVSYFNLLGIYPVDLMSRALSPEFLLKTYGKNPFSYPRAILCLHNAAEIFFKDKEMNRLSSYAARLLAKKYTDYIPDPNYPKNLNINEKMFVEVMDLMRETRGGIQFVVGDHILTHHQRGDIIMCNDGNGNPVDVSNAFPLSEFGLIRRVPDNNTWIVLVIASRNVNIRQSNEASGLMQMKMRELAALGYHAAFVHWSTFINLQSKDEKVHYLNRITEEALENKQERLHSSV